MDIVFYQLTVSPLEKVLPKLLEKAYAQGLRSVVLSNEERLKTLDVSLWTYSSGAFLPHAIASSLEDAKSVEFDAMQPILLTSRLCNPNGASLLVLTQEKLQETLEELLNGSSSFTKCLYLNDGEGVTEADIQNFQNQFVAKKMRVIHWKQTVKGEWEKIGI